LSHSSLLADYFDNDQGNLGVLYNVDDEAAGDTDISVGSIFRSRFYAKLFADIDIGGTMVRCSGVTRLFIPFSVTYGGSIGKYGRPKWTVSNDQAANGDNVISVNPAVEPVLSWNLK